jgi:CheY-like chemotaxis protein
MPHGGTLLVETSMVDLDEAYAAEHLGVAPGRYVRIAISDTGIGRDKQTLSRIFEPFFTTKDPSKGIGLGLAQVYAIVRRARGSVWVYSEEKRGTTVKLYLPEHEVGASGADALPRAPIPRRACSGETVLVLEDEALVRSAVEAALVREGYAVRAPTDVSEALAFASRGERIDVIVADIVMPELSGPELVAQIRKHHPSTPVLFVSGYSDLAALQHGLPADAAFLQKPIAPGLLARKVRQLIDGSTHAQASEREPPGGACDPDA